MSDLIGASSFACRLWSLLKLIMWFIMQFGAGMSVHISERAVNQRHSSSVWKNWLKVSHAGSVWSPVLWTPKAQISITQQTRRRWLPADPLGAWFQHFLFATAFMFLMTDELQTLNLRISPPLHSLSVPSPPFPSSPLLHTSSHPFSFLPDPFRAVFLCV